MEIVSHRGYWKMKNEKNDRIAFVQAIEHGFGIETDIRDCGGKLVISHDIPSGGEMTVEAFFSLDGIQNILLALNIKSDGLQYELKKLLERHGIYNYFVFDMSIPDTVGYFGMNLASRISEYEKELPFAAYSSHVWLDCFNSDWFSANDVKKYLSSGKKVCVVSPELHRRDCKVVWQMLKSIDGDGLMICTDMPQLAERFFNEND